MRSARKKLKKSQSDIAGETGHTQPTVHAWETGRAYPRTGELRSVARAYEMEPDQLIPEEAA